MKGLPLGLWRVQWAGSEPAPPNWCQSTQCCPGGSLRRGMKVWPSSRGFSQKAPSPRTLRWMTRCCRSPWGIRSYTSWGWGEGLVHALPVSTTHTRCLQVLPGTTASNAPDLLREGVRLCPHVLDWWLILLSTSPTANCYGVNV